MISIKFTEIKKATNQLLGSRYPYKIYGKEVKEGYETPSFFVEILDRGSRAETKNFAKGGFTITITYFQAEKNELDMLEKVDEIKELFGMVFRIGNRNLTVSDFTHDYIGEYQDILQMEIEIDYKENIRKEETAPVATNIETTITQG